MKWMIASDIHGSAYYCRKMIERYISEGADRLLLLGDLLYHGPRNDLPREYDPKAVIAMLNDMKNDIYCVRGNCDSEVDQMVLKFPILADYAVIDVGSAAIYATHGHVFDENNPPALHNGDVLLCGHTHIPKREKHATFLYLNPGSISIPKNDSVRGYMTLQDGVFLWKDLDGKAFDRLSV